MSKLVKQINEHSSSGTRQPEGKLITKQMQKLWMNKHEV